MLIFINPIGFCRRRLFHIHGLGKLLRFYDYGHATRDFLTDQFKCISINSHASHTTFYHRSKLNTYQYISLFQWLKQEIH